MICFLVFFLGLRFCGFVIIEIFLLEFEFFFIVEGLIFFIVNVGIFFLGVVGKVGWLICVLFIVFDKVSLVINVYEWKNELIVFNLFFVINGILGELLC